MESSLDVLCFKSFIIEICIGGVIIRKILAIVNLKSCGIEPHIGPIALVVQNVDLLCHRRESNIPNVKYVVSNYNNKYFRIIFQFVKGFKLCSVEDYSLIVSYSLYPYGLIALTLSKFFGIPAHMGIIGGDVDVHCKKSYKFLTLWLINQFDIITVTGSDHYQFLTQNALPRSKIYILPNSVMDKFLEPADMEKEYDLIWAGRFAPEKRPMLFLEIVLNLKKTRPDIKAIMLGDGKMMGEVIRYMDIHKLRNNIHILGWVTNIEEYYNKSKIFVLCSEREGLPIVIEEAMCCGLPVVSSNVGSIHNILFNSKNGFLIDKDSDPSEYAEKIDLILSDESTYRQYSINAINMREYCSKGQNSQIWKDIISASCRCNSYGK